VQLTGQVPFTGDTHLGMVAASIRRQQICPDAQQLLPQHESPVHPEA
jgi:hypothetical protein